MKNRNLLFAIAFAVTCTTGLSAMQENNQDDGEITPRDQVNTDEKILAQRFAYENTIASTKTYPVTVIPYQHQNTQDNNQDATVITGSELDLIVSALKKMAQNQFLK